MTRLARNRREPGSLLLKVARRVFDEETLTGIVRPAFADLQHEIREAGTSRRKRFVLRWTGLWIFCTLIVAVPIAQMQSPISGRSISDRAWRADRPYLLLLVAFFVAALFAPMMVSGWTISAIAGGILLAGGLRLWHNRHPARLADSSGWLSAEINFSAIPVGGNAGGLICMLGCAVILLAGLPGFVWFLAAALTAAVLLASVLAMRHAARTGDRLSHRSLLGRA